MKKKVIAVALLTVLVATATGCQKEDSFTPQTSIEESVASYTVHYTIDGERHTQIIVGERSWNAFLRRMTALAREGHSVAFEREGVSRTSATKETVTYTTTSEDDAIEWCDKMVTSGYSVTITYDPKSHIYTCIAIR